MHKILAIAAGTTTCLTSASVGGYYLFGAQNGEDNGKSSLTFDDLDSFKKNVNADTKGIRGYLDGWDMKLSDAAELTDSAVFKKFLEPLAQTDTNTNIKSYLEIEHKKSVDDRSKLWYGKFTWMWTFMSMDRGLASFNVVETIDKGKMSVQGVFYLVQKEKGDDGNDVWKTKHKKESTSKEITKDQFDNYFPAAGLGLHKLQKDGWGFIEKGKESEVFENMSAHKAGMREGPVTTHTFDWTVATDLTGASFPVVYWSSNQGWWNHLYGNDWDPTSYVSKFSGVWAPKTKTA